MCEAEPGNFDGTDTVLAQQRHPNGREVPPAPLMPAVNIANTTPFHFLGRYSRKLTGIMSI